METKPKNQIKFTPEQLDAIELRGNMIVSAAAGAGKTRVMTERICREIEKGTKVDELLVVTFTKAAAAEMKQRIEDRLIGLSEEKEDVREKQRLIEAANGVSRANISTIHSFCQNVLKRNYNLVGLDPAFKVMDDADTGIYMNRALDEVVEEFYAAAENEKDEISRFIITAYHKDGGIKKLISAIYRFITARPEPIEWIKGKALYYKENYDFAARLCEEQLVLSALRIIEVFIKITEEFIDEIESGGSADELFYLETIREYREYLEKLKQPGTYDEWKERSDSLKFRPLPRRKEKAPQDIKDYKEELGKLRDKLKKLFCFTAAQEKEMAEALLPVVLKLGELTEAFIRRYGEYKQKESLIDFSDMEQLTYEVLKNDAAAAEYRNKFKFVFIDEYQDTNLVQDSIISRISRGDNLFMVGDVKQSIYRFRQAEPASFLDKLARYAYKDEKTEASEGTKVDLNRNFRSTRAVLSAANALFSKLMRGDSAGEIDYSDKAELKAGDRAEEGSAELALIDLSGEWEEESEEAQSAEPEIGTDDPDDEDAEQDDGDDIENIEAEANYIAEKIFELLKSETVFDKELGRLRPARFSDCTVLLRSPKGAAIKLINTLGAHGIPCTAELGDGYFDALEVQVFMNLLRVIDNVRQDIPLVSVMSSTIGGFTDDELIRIRTAFPGEKYDFFFERVLDAAKAAGTDEAGDNAALFRKVNDFIKKLREWRALSRLVSMEELIGRLYDETKYYVFTGAAPGGAVRRANLDLLLEKARLFESSGRHGLNAFLTLMDNVRDNTNMGAAQAASVNAVRIMSIHKSKGLEFPFVFICRLSKQFNLTSRSGSVMMDGELGVGLRFSKGYRELPGMDWIDEVPAKGRKAIRPLLRRGMEEKEASKQSAEEMRVLYVGMTRAEKRLFLVDANVKMAELVAKNASPLTDHRIVNAKNYLDWILGAYFPLGLNLENAKKGVDLPLGETVLRTVFRTASAAEATGGPVDGEAFRKWLDEAKNAEHAAVTEKLKFEYKGDGHGEEPSKSSVTARMRTGDEFEYTPAVPAFLEERKHVLTGAERGTATHRFIMLLPLERLDEESLSAKLREFTEKGLFTEEESEAVVLPAVRHFVESELFGRMLRAEKVFREQEFSLLEESGTLLQGTADCFFIENGEAVLVDYKTTSVRGKDPRRTAEAYAPQLEAYARAVEKLLRVPVKEKWVYMLAVPEAFKIE